MSDPSHDAEPPRSPLSPSRPAGTGALREALRRARAESAEHGDAVTGLRQADLSRLEILKEALDPVFAAIPPEVDLFDIGLVPGDRPRLFVDMVSFVEMGRDRRLYRFLRDGRNGRVVAAESAEVEPIVQAVTDYVARRMVERERLLASDPEPAAAAAPAPQPVGSGASVPPAGPAAEPQPQRSRLARFVATVLAFIAGGAIGTVVVVALMIAVAKGVLPTAR
ncbi:hypothetical protein GCM10008171_00260 [Methylopila jiangsuensis]|uniref:Uncharacterized protein n=1 Tax=Methylopila jiangsuensis TaxID=586230 RepID=A0A9W6JEY7_9HYPH|nr:hypothetical protein [Methylopila jiangsuensis]MDR6287267.1 hypothetical protein [Methylopila jiangsuensis]GLK74774.1 hypothetical protein GCM10008171_00260 [Methylopila jiangsuensis]